MCEIRFIILGIILDFRYASMVPIKSHKLLFMKKYIIKVIGMGIMSCFSINELKQLLIGQ